METRRQGISDRTTYEQWVETEGIPILTGFFVENLRTVPVEPWKRKGALGCYINLEGTGGTNNAYVCEIPPRSHTKPQRHLFEELIFVLSGRGATTVWQEGGNRQTFEWQAGSLFSPPLNAWHQHFNGQGQEPARYVAVTTAPTVIDLFHNIDFVMSNNYEFTDRFAGEEGYFSGQGADISGRIWDTNFVADLRAFQLRSREARGVGDRNMMFELAHNTMCAHVSEFPVGTYKKGHRHGPGAHVIVLGGEGYSLLWPEGQPIKRVNWKEASLVVPPAMWFHQHFNPGTEPARYLALRWGSRKYRRGADVALRRDNVLRRYSEISLKEGGGQIEYEDEDPQVYRLFQEECRKRGAEVKMPKHPQAKA